MLPAFSFCLPHWFNPFLFGLLGCLRVHWDDGFIGGKGERKDGVCVCVCVRGLRSGEARWEERGWGRRGDRGSAFHLLFGWTYSFCLRLHWRPTLVVSTYFFPVCHAFIFISTYTLINTVMGWNIVINILISVSSLYHRSKVFIRCLIAFSGISRGCVGLLGFRYIIMLLLH